MFTVGHSNHTIERFLELLRRHRIEAVADVRSQPYSKYSPQFDSDSLARSLETCGIQYIFLGRELGGRPTEPSFYDRDGRVLYSLVAKSPVFDSGLEKLMTHAQSRLALLCSEENPSVCHRRLLVTRVLHERGVEVAHIRGDGRLQSETELLASESADQMTLFDDAKVREWRSIPSVLPKRQRSSSSAT